MGCINLSKSLNGVLRCKKLRRNINIYTDCKNCSNFILKKNKPIMKHSTNRQKVDKEVYEKVFSRDKCCKLLDNNCNGRLELHHIIYRSEDRSLINEPSNCIMLCTYHHKLVHSNKHKYQNILKNIIKKT